MAEKRSRHDTSLHRNVTTDLRGKERANQSSSLRVELSDVVARRKNKKKKVKQPKSRKRLNMRG